MKPRRRSIEAAEKPAAMTPPEGSTVVTSGGCVLGYRHDPHPCPKLSKVHGRAASRLTQLGALARLRARSGVLLPDPAGWLYIIVDALSELAGVGHWRLTTRAILRHLPELDRSSISPEMIDAAMELPRRPGRLLSDAEAGSLVGLTYAEHAELVDEDMVLALHPVDETKEARAARRADRERVMARARQKQRRKRQKEATAKSVTARNVTLDRSKVTFERVTPPIALMHRDTGNVTFRAGKAPAAVLAAVMAGHSTVREIVEHTGFSEARVKMALRRHCDNGVVLKHGRGRYGPARHRPAYPRGRRAAPQRLANCGADIRVIAARIAASVAPLNAAAARFRAAVKPAIRKLEET